MEKWKDIQGYEGSYAVSDTGFIKSLARQVETGRGSMRPIRERILRPCYVGPMRYQAVQLCKQGAMKLVTVHTTVAATFIGERPAGMQVAHEDGDSQNNALSNLSYKTVKANQADRKRHGTHNMGTAHPLSKLNEEQVIQIRKLRASMKIHEIAKSYGVSRSCIESIVYGYSWKHL